MLGIRLQTRRHTTKHVQTRSAVRWLSRAAVATLMLTAPGGAGALPAIDGFSGFSWVNSEGDNLYGWQLGMNVGFLGGFGAMLDAAGHYMKSGAGHTLSQYEIMAGPRYDLPITVTTASIHVLAGAELLDFLDSSDQGFVVALGAAVQSSVMGRFGVRVQLDYLPSYFSDGSSGDWFHDVRAGVGISF